MIKLIKKEINFWIRFRTLRIFWIEKKTLFNRGGGREVVNFCYITYFNLFILYTCWTDANFWKIYLPWIRTNLCGSWTCENLIFQLQTKIFSHKNMGKLFSNMFHILAWYFFGYLRRERGWQSVYSLLSYSPPSLLGGGGGMMDGSTPLKVKSAPLIFKHFLIELEC